VPPWLLPLIVDDHAVPGDTEPPCWVQLPLPQPCDLLDAEDGRGTSWLGLLGDLVSALGGVDVALAKRSTRAPSNIAASIVLRAAAAAAAAEDDRQASTNKL